ncbi:unnamed protein product, partial [Staurois parvus]
GPSGGAAGAGPPGGATGLGPSGGAAGPDQAERRAPDPQVERQVSGPQAERRAPDPQAERQVSGPQAERSGGTGPPGGTLRRSGGRRTPRWSGTGLRRARPGAGRRSGGSGLRVNWHDRWHWVRHWIVWLDSGLGSPGIRSFGSTAGTASSGKAVGSESTGMTAGTGSDIGSSDWTAG